MATNTMTETVALPQDSSSSVGLSEMSNTSETMIPEIQPQPQQLEPQPGDDIDLEDAQLGWENWRTEAQVEDLGIFDSNLASINDFCDVFDSLR